MQYACEVGSLLHRSFWQPRSGPGIPVVLRKSTIGPGEKTEPACKDGRLREHRDWHSNLCRGLSAQGGSREAGRNVRQTLANSAVGRVSSLVAEKIWRRLSNREHLARHSRNANLKYCWRPYLAKQVCIGRVRFETFVTTSGDRLVCLRLLTGSKTRHDVKACSQQGSLGWQLRS